MAQNNVRKKLSKKFGGGLYLFAGSVNKGNIIRFTDDKGTTNDINKCLGRVAGTAAAVYRKTTGRAKEELDKNVKNFHVFENQLKSWHLAESKVEELENEIQEWKRKYENIEKEKEDLF